MWLRRLGKATLTIAYAGCFLHLTDNYIGSIVLCCGDSMIPTIFNKDVVLAENISVFNKTLQKGDVVIARSPTVPQEFICKRLVGMEGDAVWDENGKQHYIPKGHVWLEGDNRQNSNDSRHYGPIPDGLLVRRVFFKILPLLDFGTLKHPFER